MEKGKGAESTVEEHFFGTDAERTKVDEVSEFRPLFPCLDFFVSPVEVAFGTSMGDHGRCSDEAGR